MPTKKRILCQTQDSHTFHKLQVPVPATSQRMKGQLKGATDVRSIPAINNMAEERIVQANSNEGDMVPDPFCGCATTLVAADALQRQWMGIDISPVAVRLINERIKRAQGIFKSIVARDDIPQRTDLGEPPVHYNHHSNKTHLYGIQGGNCPTCPTHFKIENMTIDLIIPK